MQKKLETSGTSVLLKSVLRIVLNNYIYIDIKKSGTFGTGFTIKKASYFK